MPLFVSFEWQELYGRISFLECGARFRFLLGIAGEERFCVDPKPHRSLLAFDCLPFNELAVFPRGWRCDTTPLEARGRQKKLHRYWHPKAFPSSCVANIAQPRLSFVHSERNLVYVPVCDSRAPPQTADASIDPLRIHDVSTPLGTQGGKEQQSTSESLLCPEAADKHHMLTSRLREAPEDDRAWLDLVAFQDEYVAAMEEASGVCRTLGRAKAIREKKLQVLEQGLLKTKGSVPLHLHKIQAHDDELPSADVAFDDLRAGGVLIPAEITLEGFADADKDLELCAELTDDEIIHEVTEDSDADTENEEPAPTQPTNTELTRALMTLSLVYSGNMTLTEIEADIIAGKRTVQKKISDFFAPKC
ncbi:hypothetical protein HPB52_004762 [Rhipicephalus sanguineus]|uniref:Uncharacterized protein n=1 Tax=Rhipicephalus sanguineus TaxID=34632 RepID=A0A9D4T5F2_RHISA|nr:hypothetical protein HPB52_004762 [Rhipicephalus sanguineus]